MNNLIVYVHPYDKSFNHAILNAVQTNMKQNKKEFKILDLYKDNFNPVYDAKELELYSKGKTCRSQVEVYLKELKNADTLIIICPFWWNGVPGILKGFIDVVMKEGKGLTHENTKMGVKGELTNIKHTYVITTSAAPTFYIKLFLGNGIKKIFLNKTLKQLGMQKRKWINFGNITESTNIKRNRFLSHIKEYNFR